MLKPLNRETTGQPLTRPVKVLQFGEGNFLRAFVDWIVDILNERTDFNGAVKIVQPIPQGMGSMVNAQEGLYHVVLNGIQGGKASKETRLITCVTGVVNPFEDLKGYLACAENPDLKFIVSNTTEAGITFSASDSSMDVLPQTFPGKLTVLLYHRFKYFKGSASSGLILLPCELIDKNGANLKQAVLQYIALWELPEPFKHWIENSNTFCNTLVDRIVPGFPKDTIDEIRKETGFDDKIAVMAEPFHLWVIEGPESVEKFFPAAKAGLEVKFVKDLSPYRTRKVRILNGAHTALVPVAYLCGMRTVRESVDDPTTGSYIRKAIFDEIIPTLDLSKEELTKFANDVIERFQNPFIRHELSSIALNSISKYKVRVLPSVLKYVELKKALPDKLILSLATLIQFYKGEWKAEKLPVSDTGEVMNFFKEVWQDPDPERVTSKVLSNIAFWDQDLTQIGGLSKAVSGHLKKLAAGEIW